MTYNLVLFSEIIKIVCISFNNIVTLDRSEYIVGKTKALYVKITAVILVYISLMCNLHTFHNVSLRVIESCHMVIGCCFCQRIHNLILTIIKMEQLSYNFDITLLFFGKLANLFGWINTGYYPSAFSKLHLNVKLTLQ